LGSFGDNELCPECLDGVNNILKENTICIPSSYRNFLSEGFLEILNILIFYSANSIFTFISKY